MIRQPPRSTLSSSSAASDVYKRQIEHHHCQTTRGGLGNDVHGTAFFRSSSHCWYCVKLYSGPDALALARMARPISCCHGQVLNRMTQINMLLNSVSYTHLRAH